MNRGQWNMIRGPCDVIMGPCNFIMGPRNVNRDRGMRIGDRGM